MISFGWLPYHLRDVIVNGIAMRGAIPVPLRMKVLRMWGMRGSGTMAPYSTIAGGFSPRVRLTLSAGAVVNVGCTFDVSAPISIGQDTWLAPGVMILTGTHEVGPANRRAGPVNPKSVAVGTGCWIGARATILPGVTIGDGCVIGAGAVVTDDCAAHGLYVGVPARRVRSLPGVNESDDHPHPLS